MQTQKKGFTLLELLIVIGILAILASATAIVLNPAELLRQARDTQRVNDLDSLRSALALYTTSVSSPDLDGATATCATLCYVQTGGMAANCAGRHGAKVTTADADRAVDGTGWIPVALTGITGGSPLPALPTDPTNSTTLFYSYACDNTNITFEIDTMLESAKYKTDLDLDTKDGGTPATDGLYEVGTEPGLDI